MYSDISRLLLLLALCFCTLHFAGCLNAQTRDSSALASANNPINSEYTFKANVNQVLVRVVVRDSHGDAVSGLKKDDFEVFDDGKQRPIISFSESHPDSFNASGRELYSRSTDAVHPAATSVVRPESFTIYLFDDLHMKLGELDSARAAVDANAQHLSQQSSERFALFAISGKVRQPFTNDPAAIHSALAKLVSEDHKVENEGTCPYMNYYLAKLIETDSNAKAQIVTDAVRCLQVTIPGQNDTVDCSGLPQVRDRQSPGCEIARQAVEARMSQELQAGEQDGWTLLTVLNQAIRQLASTPGDRKIVLLTPGFTLDSQELAKSADRALRAGVVTDVIDARGVWGPSTYDATQSRFSQRMAPLVRDAERARFDALTQIVDSTGGRLYKNTNDLRGALEKSAGTPNSYLLSFTPENPKDDRRFHEIKVKLPQHRELQLTARKGYYEPTYRTKPGEASAPPLANVLFSQVERNDIPLDVRLHSGRVNGEGLIETVAAAQVDIRTLPFHRDKDRLIDVVTEVCGVFDENGNFMTAVQNNTNINVTPTELAKLGSGITVNSTFKLKPGVYTVRIVLQDREGKMISAKSVPAKIG